MVIKISKQCSKCKQDLSPAAFDKNGKYTYSVCKTCKRLRVAAQRYNLTIEQARELYNITHCMCCNLEFTKQRLQHIHHTTHGVQGIICQYCNHILAQETNDDLKRIKSCLSYIQQPRKNLFGRVNSQGSLRDPSTTTRLARFNNQQCIACKRILPLDAFGMNNQWRRKKCKHCCVCTLQAKTYNLSFEEVYNLRLYKICDCCKNLFTRKNFATIHHIKDQVLGLVCNNCNRCLGQETFKQVKRLQACLTWIKAMMI